MLTSAKIPTSERYVNFGMYSHRSDSLEECYQFVKNTIRELATGQIWNRFTPCLWPIGLKTDIEKVTTREDNERWLNLYLSGQSCPCSCKNRHDRGIGSRYELCNVKPYSQNKFWCQNWIALLVWVQSSKDGIIKKHQRAAVNLKSS